MKTIAKFLSVLGLNYLLIFKLPRFIYMTTGLSPKTVNSGNITQFSLLLAVAVYMLVKKRNFADMGFKTCSGKTAAKALGIGTVMGALGMVLMMLIVTFWLKMNPEGDHGSSSSFFSDVLSVWIIASSCEEIFYRGGVMDLFGNLKDKGLNVLGKRLSLPIILAAFLFGISHFCLLSMLPYKMVTGVVLNGIILSLFAGYFREKSGSLIPAYIIHLMFNVVGKVASHVLGG